LKDEGGQDIVEYSLLLVLIGAAAVFILTTMGSTISSIFSKINAKLNTADSQISRVNVLPEPLTRAGDILR
jgi:Flp pilus assembly pilin Flp